MPAESSSRAQPDEIAIQEDINTRKGVERIIRYAFEYCENHTKLDGSPRQRVLMCDKSNAMTHAGGLWQRVFKEVSGRISANHGATHVRRCILHADGSRSPPIRRHRDQQYVRRHHHRPRRRPAGWPRHGRERQYSSRETSMFEPVHGSAPPSRGRTWRIPFGAILTTAMMLGSSGINERSREKSKPQCSKPSARKILRRHRRDARNEGEVGEWVAELRG